MAMSDVYMKCFPENVRAVGHFGALDGDERMTVEQGM
jgi:hypothetical protein